MLGSGQPRIWDQVDKDLAMLRRWLLGRVWPGRYPSLEYALGNFGRVLQDFQDILHKHLQPRGKGEDLFTPQILPDRTMNHRCKSAAKPVKSIAT